MEKFFPSEIARLVLGYLKEINCPLSSQSFLKECPDLNEYSSLLQQGHEYTCKVQYKSLKEILDEYCILKQNSQNNFSGTVNTVQESLQPSTSRQSPLDAVFKTPKKNNLISALKQRSAQKTLTQSVSASKAQTRRSPRTPHSAHSLRLSSVVTTSLYSDERNSTNTNVSTTEKRFCYSDPVSQRKLNSKLVQTDVCEGSKKIHSLCSDGENSREIPHDSTENIRKSIDVVVIQQNSPSDFNLDKEKSSGEEENLIKTKSLMVNQSIRYQTSEITARENSLTVSTTESSVTPQYESEPPPYQRAPGTNSPRLFLSLDRSLDPKLITTPKKDLKIWTDDFSSPRRKSLPRRRLMETFSFTPKKQTANIFPTPSLLDNLDSGTMPSFIGKLTDDINKVIETSDNALSHSESSIPPKKFQEDVIKTFFENISEADLGGFNEFLYSLENVDFPLQENEKNLSDEICVSHDRTQVSQSIVSTNASIDENNKNSSVYMDTNVSHEIHVFTDNNIEENKTNSLEIVDENTTSHKNVKEVSKSSGEQIAQENRNNNEFSEKASVTESVLTSNSLLTSQLPEESQEVSPMECDDVVIVKEVPGPGTPVTQTINLPTNYTPIITNTNLPGSFGLNGVNNNIILTLPNGSNAFQNLNCPVEQQLISYFPNNLMYSSFPNLNQTCTVDNTMQTKTVYYVIPTPPPPVNNLIISTPEISTLNSSIINGVSSVANICEVAATNIIDSDPSSFITTSKMDPAPSTVAPTSNIDPDLGSEPVKIKKCDTAPSNKLNDEVKSKKKSNINKQKALKEVRKSNRKGSKSKKNRLSQSSPIETNKDCDSNYPCISISPSQTNNLSAMQLLSKITNGTTVESPLLKIMESPEIVQSSPLKAVESPQLKAVQSPTLKEAQSPQLKKVQSPQLKKVQSPQLKKVPSPQLKKVPSPQLIKVQSPLLKEKQPSLLNELISSAKLLNNQKGCLNNSHVRFLNFGVSNSKEASEKTLETSTLINSMPLFSEEDCRRSSRLKEKRASSKSPARNKAMGKERKISKPSPKKKNEKITQPTNESTVNYTKVTRKSIEIKVRSDPSQSVTFDQTKTNQTNSMTDDVLNAMSEALSKKEKNFNNFSRNAAQCFTEIDSEMLLKTDCITDIDFTESASLQNIVEKDGENEKTKALYFFDRNSVIDKEIVSPDKFFPSSASDSDSNSLIPTSHVISLNQDKVSSNSNSNGKNMSNIESSKFESCIASNMKCINNDLIALKNSSTSIKVSQPQPQTEKVSLTSTKSPEMCNVNSLNYKICERDKDLSVSEKDSPLISCISETPDPSKSFRDASKTKSCLSVKNSSAQNKRKGKSKTTYKRSTSKQMSKKSKKRFAKSRAKTDPSALEHCKDINPESESSVKISFEEIPPNVLENCVPLSKKKLTPEKDLDNHISEEPTSISIESFNFKGCENISEKIQTNSTSKSLLSEVNSCSSLQGLSSELCNKLETTSLTGESLSNDNSKQPIVPAQISDEIAKNMLKEAKANRVTSIVNKLYLNAVSPNKTLNTSKKNQDIQNIKFVESVCSIERASQEKMLPPPKKRIRPVPIPSPKDTSLSQFSPFHVAGSVYLEAPNDSSFSKNSSHINLQDAKSIPSDVQSVTSNVIHNSFRTETSSPKQNPRSGYRPYPSTGKPKAMKKYYIERNIPISPGTMSNSSCTLDSFIKANSKNILSVDGKDDSSSSCNNLSKEGVENLQLSSESTKNNFKNPEPIIIDSSKNKVSEKRKLNQIMSEEEHFSKTDKHLSLSPPKKKGKLTDHNLSNLHKNIMTHSKNNNNEEEEVNPLSQGIIENKTSLLREKILNPKADEVVVINVTPNSDETDNVKQINSAYEYNYLSSLSCKNASKNQETTKNSPVRRSSPPRNTGPKSVKSQRLENNPKIPSGVKFPPKWTKTLASYSTSIENSEGISKASKEKTTEQITVSPSKKWSLRIACNPSPKKFKKSVKKVNSDKTDSHDIDLKKSKSDSYSRSTNFYCSPKKRHYSGSSKYNKNKIFHRSRSFRHTSVPRTPIKISDSHKYNKSSHRPSKHLDFKRKFDNHSVHKKSSSSHDNTLSKNSSFARALTNPSIHTSKKDQNPSDFERLKTYNELERKKTKETNKKKSMEKLEKTNLSVKTKSQSLSQISEKNTSQHQKSNDSCLEEGEICDDDLDKQCKSYETDKVSTLNTQIMCESISDSKVNSIPALENIEIPQVEEGERTPEEQSELEQALASLKSYMPRPCENVSISDSLSHSKESDASCSTKVITSKKSMMNEVLQNDSFKSNTHSEKNKKQSNLPSISSSDSSSTTKIVPAKKSNLDCLLNLPLCKPSIDAFVNSTIDNSKASNAMPYENSQTKIHDCDNSPSATSSTQKTEGKPSGEKLEEILKMIRDHGVEEILSSLTHYKIPNEKL